MGRSLKRGELNKFPQQVLHAQRRQEEGAWTSNLCTSTRTFTHHNIRTRFVMVITMAFAITFFTGMTLSWIIITVITVSPEP